MGGERHSPFTKELDATIEALMSRWHVPGLSIAITDHGNVSSKGYGYAEVPDAGTQSKGEPCKPETLFHIGSITKHMFAACFAQYIDSDQNKVQGKAQVTFSTPLADIIRDDFVLGDPYTTAQTTIEDALSHRTGLPGFDACYGGPLDNVQKITRHMRHLSLSAPLRTKFQYCNIGYIAASHAFETLTETTVQDALYARLFEPLAMSHTYSRLSDVREGTGHPGSTHKLATPYHWENDRFHKMPYFDAPEVAGAGCIFTNTPDMARWMQCLLTQAPPLSRAAHEELVTPRSIKQDAMIGVKYSLYGLGLFRHTIRGVEVFTHSGGLIGFVSQMVLVPSLQWGCIMCVNVDWTPSFMVQVLMHHLLDELLGVRKGERIDVERRVRGFIEKKEKERRDAKGRIFPNVPEKPLPLTVKVQAYAGWYVNKAFRELKFEVLEGESEETAETEKESAKLRAVATDRTWQFDITLKHVSGEFWLGELYNPNIPMAFKAESKVGADGKVVQLGLALEEAFGDELFWFDRIGD